MVIEAEPGLPKESTTEAVIMWVPTDSVDISKELSSGLGCHFVKTKMLH